MKKLYLLILVSFFIGSSAHAQYSKYIIQLKNKGGTTHSLSNPSTYLSAKAIERRTRQKLTLDSTDLPVSAAYLTAIRQVPNVTVLNVSKWLNQVLITTTDAAALTQINNLPFVKGTSPIAAQARPNDNNPVSSKFKEVITSLPPSEIRNGAYGTSGSQGTPVLNYGNSFAQIHLHEGEYLHDLGFTGQGITIAILDAGFYGYKTNSAIDSIRLQNRVLGEWDYVMNETSVTEDHPHGLYCLSIIGANKPGQIIGSAPHAKFFLLRTEDAATEYPVEEQNWVVAAEFADSAGVDMITSSLGYADFDDPVFNHSYAQRNGNTAMITIGADLAVKKGIIVTNSAGNSGGQAGEAKYVSCPADGDSVFTVGATTVTGIMAGFSSWGPNGAGRTKPNIVSVGQGTVLANTAGNASAGNGTSFSNPLACGLIACLWQAFPEFTNMEITNAVQKSSSRYSSPDAQYGYGIPNFRLAYEILTKDREARNIAGILGDRWLKPYPVPFKQELKLVLKAPVTGKAGIQLLDALGRLIETKGVDITTDQIYVIEFSRAQGLPHGTYYIRYTDGKNKELVKVMK
ncbi:MAG: S8 family peptidase [Chitinophagaceae bacterium]|nr:S8 family peptidase [Chitinophagaceae bacterium]